jgi:hypothetical protein
MLKFTFAVVALALALGSAGCSRPQELMMVDPRTGVQVACILDSSVTTSLTSVGLTRQAYSCIDELQYYGFRDAETVQ